MQATEKTLHDRINLPRLVKRLESTVKENSWTVDGPARRDSWIKARGTLQKIRHAHTLLKNVELDEPATTPCVPVATCMRDVNAPSRASERHYQHIRTTLDRLETYMLKTEKQLAPPVQRPKLILPSIPPPIPRHSLVHKDSEQTPQVEIVLIPAEGNPSTPEVEVNDLLPATPELSPTQNTYITSFNVSAAPPSSSNITATPTILQNSRALQEELSEQLALMAAQLRRNATHFSDSLANDKAVVETMQEKLEGNFDFLKKQRIRLRDFRGKSGGTTCLVIMSVIVVLIAFIIMVLVIRVT
ncbi:hypothetical protein V8B97DRAFT_2003509 [Scleroderma yunnanense]